MTAVRVSFLLILAIVLLPAQAFADLIFLGSAPQSGSGLGSVQTVLTLGTNDGDASGSVTCDAVLDNGCTDVVSPGDTQAINQTRSFAEAGLTQASDFRLIFNANEPGNDTTITINSLSVFFYAADGDLYKTATLQGVPVTFTGDFNGTGAQGQVFGLSAADALLVQSQFSLNNRIGVSASISLASGGLETFNVGFASSTTPVPEPASMLLLGGGLAGLAAVRRRRRR